MWIVCWSIEVCENILDFSIVLCESCTCFLLTQLQGPHRRWVLRGTRAAAGFEKHDLNLWASYRVSETADCPAAFQQKAVAMEMAAAHRKYVDNKQSPGWTDLNTFSSSVVSSEWFLELSSCRSTKLIWNQMNWLLGSQGCWGLSQSLLGKPCQSITSHKTTTVDNFISPIDVNAWLECGMKRECLKPNWDWNQHLFTMRWGC